MNRVVCVMSLVVWGALGCRSAPSEAGPDGSGAGSVPAIDEEAATGERCVPVFQGQMMNPRGETLQRETSQTGACAAGDCGARTFAMLSPRYFAGHSCDEVRANIKDRPIMDAWGAQARVICNGEMAQAVSAGPDGRLGTCDDIASAIAVNPDVVVH